MPIDASLELGSCGIYRPIELSNEFLINGLMASNKAWLINNFTETSLKMFGFRQEQVVHLHNYRDVETQIKPVMFMVILKDFAQKVADYNNRRLQANLTAIPIVLFPLNMESETIHTPIPGNPTPVTFTEDDLVGELDSEEEVDTNYSGESAHDLNVKYQETYVTKGSEVIFLQEFSNSTPPTLHYKTLTSSGNIGVLRSMPWDGSLFNTLLPKLGLINIKDGVIYVEREHRRSSPARYRKTLRHDVVKISDLCSKEHRQLGDTSFDNDYYTTADIFKKSLYSIFFPQHFAYEEALDLVLTNRRLAAAFSSSMAIRLCSITNKILLMKYQWPIGHYDFKTESFEMLIDLYKHDLIKYNIPVNKK